MAIPTLPGFKRRRRGAGQEVNDFVKAFLATRKSFADSALAEKRGKLYDAQIARYEEMNAASKERRERAGKGGSGGMTQEQMDQHIKNSLARAPEGRTAVSEDRGYSPPLAPRMEGQARGIKEAPVPQSEPEKPAPPPARIDPRLGALPVEDTANDSGSRVQLAALKDDVAQQAVDADYAPASFDYAPQAVSDLGGYDVVQYSAEGGTVQGTEQLAPLSEALDAALKSVQSSYGLDQRGTAVDDGSSAANLEAFARNEGAMPEETMTDLLMTVDPNSKDKIAAVLQKVYGFHTGNGDRVAAAGAVGSILQAARQESMDLGAIAMAAIEQRDFMAAGEALIDAYNKVPDGRYVEGNVDERGVGEALIRDAQTDKVVQRMPLNPQTLQMAAKRFQSGADYYNHLAQFARPAQTPRQRVALAYGGGLMEDEPDMMSAIDEADREDERLVEDLPLNEDGAQAAPVAQQQETPEADEADMPARGAQPVEGALPERKYVPYAPGMNATQRRQVDRINSQLGAEYRRQDAIDKERRLEERRQRERAEDKTFNVQRDILREAAANRRTDATTARQAATAAETAKRQEHLARLGRDFDYRREYELVPLAEQERKDRAYMGEIAREVNRASLSGEDVDISGSRKEGERTALQPWRAELGAKREEISAAVAPRRAQRLNITAKNAPTFEAADPEEVTKALDAYANRAKPDKMGYIDPKQKVTIDDDLKSGMTDLAVSLTRFNDISAKRAGELVFDVVMKQDVAPEVTRSDQGFRVSIGNRSVVMNNNMFQEIAILRGQRAKEVNAINEPIKKRMDEAEAARVRDAYERRSAIDEYDQRLWDMTRDGSIPARQIDRMRESGDFLRQRQEQLRRLNPNK